MRIFASDRVQRILELVGMTEDVDIQSGDGVARRSERAQKRVEERNFEIRKNLLEYDEVMDKQRRTVYGLRQEVLEGSDVKERILEMVADDVERDRRRLHRREAGAEGLRRGRAHGQPEVPDQRRRREVRRQGGRSTSPTR